MSMSSTSILRVAARHTITPCRTAFRPALQPRSRTVIANAQRTSRLSTSSRLAAAVDKDEHDSSHSHEETFEEFTSRFEKEFEGVQDVFELQRNLNNAFAYDLVPSPSVLIAALKAARRVNDFPTAVRIFEGIKAKVENKGQYEQYLEELKPLREELGVPLKEDLYPEEAK